MEIGIFYSMNNSEHRKAADFVRRAVKNLGIQATITEMDSNSSFPRLVVDGYDLSNLLRKRQNKGKRVPVVSYDQVERALESTAWL